MESTYQISFVFIGTQCILSNAVLQILCVYCDLLYSDETGCTFPYVDYQDKKIPFGEQKAIDNQDDCAIACTNERNAGRQCIGYDFNVAQTACYLLKDYLPFTDETGIIHSHLEPECDGAVRTGM